MPTTLADRVLAAATLVSAAVLVALVAANWEAFRPPPSRADEAGATQRRGGPASAPADVAATRRELAEARAASTRDVRPAAPAPAPALVLRAVDGPTWLEARAGDAAGTQLHYGLLPAGGTRRFEPLPVWIRVGAAANVDMRIGRSQLDVPAAAPDGVVEFVVSADGIEP